ncbi:cupin domain-containing protein [Roseateles amylovorans]|uniref:Cupin domain-containing protein n=1 Tax=Roseateles amylovorans TaxID=2978473 RepID=A0ABY6B6A7_9BURK|nr:cupin domain-containing protein [Roseateles amylovorans]UXH79476.1 cupin domain-containing protein [Roseateles amylovorans]
MYALSSSAQPLTPPPDESAEHCQAAMSPALSRRSTAPPPVTVESLANVTPTYRGEPVQMPPSPRLTAAVLNLESRQPLDRASGLVARYAYVQEGTLCVVEADGAGHVTHQRGSFVADTGQLAWAGTDGAQLLLIDHRDPATQALPADRGSRPGARLLWDAVGSYNGDPLRMPAQPRVLAAHYTVEPAAKLPVHMHPAPRYGQMLSGQLEITDVDTGRVRRFEAGELIVEMQNRWHSAVNVGSEPVRLLVIDHVAQDADHNTVMWHSCLDGGHPPAKPAQSGATSD